MMMITAAALRNCGKKPEKVTCREQISQTMEITLIPTNCTSITDGLYSSDLDNNWYVSQSEIHGIHKSVWLINPVKRETI